MALLAAFFLFFLPLQWALPLGGWGTVPLFRVGALLLLVGWGSIWLLRRESKLPPLQLTLPIIGFLGAAACGLLFQSTLPATWERKLVFLLGLLPLIFVWWWLFERGYHLLLLQALLFGTAISAVFGLGLFFLQFVIELDVLFHWLTTTLLPFFLGERLHALVTQFPSLLVEIGGIPWLRVTAFFPDPHVAALFYGLAGWLAFGLFFETRRVHWLIIAGVIFLAHLLTFSRGGYLGLLASMALFWMLTRVVPTVWSYGKLVLVGSVPILLMLLAPVGERFLSSFLLNDASSTDRLLLWQTAWEVWSHNLLWGVGVGQYAETALPFLGGSLPYYAHNLLLDVGVELGWVGLGFWLWLLIGAWYRALQRSQVARAPWYSALVAAITLYLVHSMFETAIFSVHVTALLTLVLTLAYADRPIEHRVQ